MENIIPYLAGYADGDGCISCAYQSAKHLPTLTFGVHSGDIGTLKLFAETFGGKVIPHKRNSAKNRQMYSWSVSGKRASEVLFILEPYLIAKRIPAIAASLFKFDFPKNYGVPKWQREARIYAANVIRSFNHRVTRKA